MKNQPKKMQCGFTLSEILITLSIMGFLMALTIPTLMQSSFKSSYVVGLKKAYSLLEEATSQIIMNNAGTLKNAFTDSTDALTKYGNILEFNKTCVAGSVAGNCWANSTKPLFGGAIQEGFNANTNYQGAVLSDGTSLLVYISNATCNGAGVSTVLPAGTNNSLCGYIIADVNGFSNPNQFGRDQFVFLLGSNGLYQGGDAHTTYNDLSVNCNSSDTTHNGYGCASKVLNEGEMKY